LFAYEIYGIRKCHALIIGGKQLEFDLHTDGQFSLRPRSVAGFLNEPLAAGIIYPAVLGAWTFVALYTVWPEFRGPAAILVFLTGFASMLIYNLRLGADKEAARIELLNERILQAEERGDAEALAPYLHSNFSIVRASGEKQER
jgi:hypothetical protein